MEKEKIKMILKIIMGLILIQVTRIGLKFSVFCFVEKTRFTDTPVSALIMTVFIYIITTLLFAIWHIGYIDTIMYRVEMNKVPFIMLMKVITGLCFGIVLGAVRYKTRNSYSTILMHSLMNLFGK